jgi:hypothetical protein
LDNNSLLLLPKHPLSSRVVELLLVVLELHIVLFVEGAQSADLVRIAESVNAKEVPEEGRSSNPQSEALVLAY